MFNSRVVFNILVIAVITFFGGIAVFILQGYPEYQQCENSPVLSQFQPNWTVIIGEKSKYHTRDLKFETIDLAKYDNKQLIMNKIYVQYCSTDNFFWTHNEYWVYAELQYDDHTVTRQHTLLSINSQIGYDDEDAFINQPAYKFDISKKLNGKLTILNSSDPKANLHFSTSYSSKDDGRTWGDIELPDGTITTFK